MIDSSNLENAPAILNFSQHFPHTNVLQQLLPVVLYAKRSTIDLMSKLNIVCEMIAYPNGTIGHTPTDKVPVVAHAEFTPENQRGTWNQDVIKFWVKGGETDELFQNRVNYLRKIFNVAFTEVDIEIPIVFIVAEDEMDADIIIEFSSKEGDKYYPGDKSKNVLAYAGYPDGALRGYMKIFTDWDWNVFGNMNILSVIIHELLHLLGRPHSTRGFAYNDIMHPSIRSNITELSDFDILGLTDEYGPRVYKHDTHHDRLEHANKRQKVRLMLDAVEPFQLS